MTRIRIKDIAKLANVSPGTVDRVLHNRSGVSKATADRIRTLLKEYDFQPDILAGALAASRKFRFLVCMPKIVDAHAFWKFPEAGVKRALDEIQHFDVSVDYLRFDQHKVNEFIKLIEEIDPSEYDGLLFAPVFSLQSSLFIKRWKDSGLPVILFNSKIEGEGVDGFIGQDAFQSGFLGGKLMSFGLQAQKDLLIVNLSMRKDNYQHIIKRERGFRAWFEEHSERVNNLVTLNIDGGAYGKLSDTLDIKMRELNVAGIFATNSRVHLVARYLAERGAMNIRLIGYDLIPESVDYLKREYIDFLISQSPEEQSYLGLRYLFSMVVLKKSAPDEILMPIDILTKENIEHYLKFTNQNE